MILYYTIILYIILYYITLYIILHYIIYYIILYYIIYYITLYIILYYIILYYTILYDIIWLTSPAPWRPSPGSTARRRWCKTSASTRTAWRGTQPPSPSRYLPSNRKLVQKYQVVNNNNNTQGVHDSSVTGTTDGSPRRPKQKVFFGV